MNDQPKQAETVAIIANHPLIANNVLMIFCWNAGDHETDESLSAATYYFALN